MLIPRMRDAHGPTNRITEAILMRNAGGRVEPILNDILGVDTLVKATDVMVVHHTGNDVFPILLLSDTLC